MPQQQQAQYRGLPLKDRSAEDIRAALSRLEEDVVAEFVSLHAYARSEHLGISQLAQQTGISTAVLSPAFNGAYVGDYSAIAERIKTFFWRLKQKEMFGGLREFKETALARVLWQVFEKIRICRRIQIVEGPEQVGKSRAAEEYAARNNSGRTSYVTLSGGSQSGLGDFIWNLAESLGIPYTVKLREKKIRIRQALASCDLVLIDEAHLAFTWNDRALADWLDYLRTDLFANGERGVVLIVTNSDFLAGLQLWRKRARYNLGQLLGRMRHDVVRIDPAEDIVESDVALLTSRYYDAGKTIVRRLHGIATQDQFGHYGLLQDILDEAWTRAKARKRKLDDAIVNDVASEILGNLKTKKELYQ